MTKLINPKSQPKGNLYSLAHFKAPIMSMDMFFISTAEMEAEQRGETWKWKGGKKERQTMKVMSLPDVTSHYN